MTEWLEANLLELESDTIEYRDFNGLGPQINWLDLTYNERIIKSVGPYRKHAEVWQYKADWIYANFPRVYVQLARGHDKTEREAWWALCWMESRPDGQGLCCGSDKDNARLFRDAAKWIVKTHQHLFGNIRVHNYDIIHRKNGSHIRVIPSDEEGNYGHTIDLLMVNDFHSWKNVDFWNALYTAVGKRKGIRIWIESNALQLGSEQASWIKPIREMTQEATRTGKIRFDRPALTPEEMRVWDKNKAAPPCRASHGPRWYYWGPKRFYATWQYHQLAEWKKTLLPQSFRRLIFNEDTTDGDQFLTEEQVEACEKPRILEPKKGARKLVCVDMAENGDAAVVTFISGYRHPTDDLSQVEAHSQDVWTGSRDNAIPINEVADFAEKLAESHGCQIIGDPWELRAIMQRKPDLWIKFEYSVVKNIVAMTKLMYGLFVTKRIAIYKNMGPEIQAKGTAKPRMWNFKEEATTAVMKDMSYGTRIDNKKSGYKDRLFSLGMGIVHLLNDEEKLPRINFAKATEPEYVGVTDQTMGHWLDRLTAKPPERIIY